MITEPLDGSGWSAAHCGEGCEVACEGTVMLKPFRGECEGELWNEIACRSGRRGPFSMSEDASMVLGPKS